jgi:hypothetical protein
MSGETLAHVRLVEFLIAFVERRLQGQANVLVLADHHRFGTDRPPQLGGFTPDVFACDVPATFRIVGEAKTLGDLESERSIRQLGAFLAHLALYSESSLYIAVPWLAAPKARMILKALRNEQHASVVVEVIACT